MDQEKIRKLEADYYKLIRKRAQGPFLKGYQLCFNGQCFYPKRNLNDEEISVTKLTIISPRILRILIRRKAERKKQLEAEMIAKQEEADLLKKQKENERAILLLKEELEKLKQQPEKEQSKSK